MILANVGVLFLLIIPTLSVKPSLLSTFRIQQFHMSVERDDSGGIFHEAYQVLRKYFLHRHRFNASEWDSMKKELSGYTNSQQVKVFILLYFFHLVIHHFSFIRL